MKYAGVTKSLTPGRNNGFVNMLNLMKTKAGQFKQQQRSSSSGGDASSSSSGGDTASSSSSSSSGASSSSVVVVVASDEERMKSEVMMDATTATTIVASNLTRGGGGGGGVVYQSIYRKLSLLQPLSMVIEDESYKHAGHSGKHVDRVESMRVESMMESIYRAALLLLYCHSSLLYSAIDHHCTALHCTNIALITTLHCTAITHHSSLPMDGWMLLLLLLLLLLLICREPWLTGLRDALLGVHRGCLLRRPESREEASDDLHTAGTGRGVVVVVVDI